VPETTPALTVERTDTDEFSLVGVTWAYDPAVTDTVVQVRVQDADGAWGGWTEVVSETADKDLATAPGSPQQRGGTAPLWTGPSTGVQAELVTRSGAQPTDVQLDLVDPGTSDADDELGSGEITDTANAAQSMPAVYSRAQWGADEAIRTWAPEYASTIKAATVHHTADSNGYTADQVPAIMRSIYRYHTVSLRWGDIGYNVIVDKFGRLWEGRAGGLASTVIAAHAGGFNTGTFGVSMLGNYDVVGVPQATVDSVSAIIAWKFALYGINPRGTTVLTSAGGGTSRYAAGTPVTLPTIFAHRDVGATACPGAYGFARMGEIRDRVTATVGNYVSPVAEHYANPAVKAMMGNPLDIERTSADGIGRYRNYQYGTIIWHPSAGVHGLVGGIRGLWISLGSERGTLGYPTTEIRCGLTGGGCAQDFQHGSVYWSDPTGSRPLYGGIRAVYQAGGAEAGALGYPSTDMVCALPGGGCRQQFQRGVISWSPATGAFAVTGAIYTSWNAQGAQSGPLGYPRDAMTCTAEQGCWQSFQGGALTWRSDLPDTRTVSGAVGAMWLAASGGNGPLGAPLAELTCTLPGGGCSQTFAGGSAVWWPDTGAHAVLTKFLGLWTATGRESGPLGKPVSSTVCGVADGCTQEFQKASLAWSPDTGTRTVTDGIRAYWTAARGAAGFLGYPRAEVDCTTVAGICQQSFQGGDVVSTAATGTKAVSGAIRTRWVTSSGAAGALAAPSIDMVCGLARGGCAQHFQGGTVHWSAASDAHATYGSIRQVWHAMGAETSALAYPTTEMDCATVAGICRQDFQGGSLVWSPTGGTRAVSGAIGQVWAASGAAGAVGVPVTDMVCGLNRGGCGQHFARGSIFWLPTTGGHVVEGGIRDAWFAQNGQDGVLGYPVSGMVCSAAVAGCEQRFQGGTLRWEAASGRVLRR
jgi:uncharacterized protein with LGFP repeats